MGKKDKQQPEKQVKKCGTCKGSGLTAFGKKCTGGCTGGWVAF